MPTRMLRDALVFSGSLAFRSFLVPTNARITLTHPWPLTSNGRYYRLVTPLRPSARVSLKGWAIVAEGNALGLEFGHFVFVSR